MTQGTQLNLFPATDTLSKSAALQALHSSESSEHYTYPTYLDLTRLIFTITLDAASSEAANKLHKIPRFFSLKNSALTQDWGSPDKPENVWLNPPGGKNGNESTIKAFWHKAFKEWKKGNINHLMFCAFNLELFQTGQIMGIASPQRCPFVICRQRVKYLRLRQEWLDLLTFKIETSTGAEQKKLIRQRNQVLKKPLYPLNNLFVSGDSPPSATMFIYLPGGIEQWEKEVNARMFEKVFSQLGDVILPRLMP